jgi:hypothetical protein
MLERTRTVIDDLVQIEALGTDVGVSLPSVTAASRGGDRCGADGTSRHLVVRRL